MIPIVKYWSLFGSYYFRPKYVVLFLIWVLIAPELFLLDLGEVEKQ